MRLAIAPIFAALAALATAYTQPNYNEDPTGNAITTPSLNELVPAGKPFTIQWDPTTTGPIDLVLLRGPSTNVVPIATIAEGIANSGSYVWTPSTDLTPDVTHYGLLLVVEATGQYQYSTQFGISNPDYSGSSSSSVAPAATTASSSSSSSTSTVTSSNASATDSSATTLLKVTSDKKTETASANTTVTTAVSVTATSVPTTTVQITQTAASSTVTIPISVAVTSHTPSSTPTPSTTSSGANRESLSIAAIAAAGAFAVLAF